MNYLKYMAFAAGILLLNACGNPSPPVRSGESFCIDSNFKKALRFKTAERRPVSENVHLIGTVEANPDKVSVVRSLVNGVVSAVRITLGETVRAGQSLADVSSSEYSALQSELQSIESQLRVAEVKRQSAEALHKDGVASRSDLNQAIAEVEVLQAGRTRILNHRNLYSANASRNSFQLKAPASGIVTLKSVTPGSRVSGEDETPLFTVTNLDDVWILANIYASNLQHVRQGMAVEIRTSSYPDEIFRGTISMISQAFDEKSKVLNARIVVPNKDLKLKPGMHADITVLKQSEQQAVSIPTSEAIFSDNEYYVVVYRGDCDIEVRPIKVLSRNDNMIFVKSGLAAGEQIITRNQLLLFNRLHQ